MIISIFLIFVSKFCVLKVGSNPLSTALISNTTSLKFFRHRRVTNTSSLRTTIPTTAPPFLHSKEATTKPTLPTYKTTSVASKHDSVTHKTTPFLHPKEATTKPTLPTYKATSVASKHDSVTQKTTPFLHPKEATTKPTYKTTSVASKHDSVTLKTTPKGPTTTKEKVVEVTTTDPLEGSASGLDGSGSGSGLGSGSGSGIDYTYGSYDDSSGTDTGTNTGKDTGTNTGKDTVVNKYDNWKNEPAPPSGFAVGLTYAFLGLGLIGAILVIISSCIFPSKGYGSIRWYCINLMLCGIVHIFIFAYNAPILNPGLQKAIGSVFNATKSYEFGPYGILKKYSKDMREWINCVYAFTTPFVSIEFIWRYVSKKSGFSHLMWYNIILIADFLPLVYIVLKNQIYSTAVIAPPPLSSYHLILIIILGVDASFFLIFTIILIFKFFIKKEYERVNHSTSFGLEGLICKVLYGIFTIFFQFTCIATVVQNILNSFGTKGAQAAGQLGISVPGLISFQLTIDEWSLAATVFAQSVGILMFMPMYPGHILLIGCFRRIFKRIFGSMDTTVVHLKPTKFY